MNLIYTKISYLCSLYFDDVISSNCRLMVFLVLLSCPKVIVRTTGVCVCVFSSHLFWTSSSLDVPAGVTQEEGHTGFLIHLPSAMCLNFSREEGFSHSFPSSTVKSNFVY